MEVPGIMAGTFMDTLADETGEVRNEFCQRLRGLLTCVACASLLDSPCSLETNFRRFCEAFELDEYEMELCRIFFFICAYDQAGNWMDNHLALDRLPGRRRLRIIAGVGASQLESLLSGKLSKIGIIDTSGVVGKFLTFSDDFLPFLLDPALDHSPQRLFKKVAPEYLPLEYHPIEGQMVNHLKGLLAEKNDHPVHLLLYGEAGSGKTSFARGLVQSLAVPAFEINKESREKRGKSMRAAIMACLNMTNRGEGSVIIVDEADLLLNTATSWRSFGETQDKGWLNQLMEEPGARIIWITNSIDGMEDSTLRRFAYSLRFRPFNRAQREQLWDRVLRRNRIKRFFDAASLGSLACHYQVSAGVMDMAAKNAATAGKNRKGIHHALKMGLESYTTLRNQGEPLRRKDQVVRDYSLEGMNIKADLPDMISRLQTYSKWLDQGGPHLETSMNLLFYGPPGTGKSELARHLAHQLDKPLLVKRASDILNPYVGMTERNLAAAFSEAENEKAVLVLDEVDSLLFSREQARHSWETSFTNEFLTQMERLRGILICTTNRMTGLDAASIRRFQEKVEFDYLTPEGKLVFYNRMLSPLAKGKLNLELVARLKKIDNLAPGDFKLVWSRHSVDMGSGCCHAALVADLEREAAIKQAHGGKRAIGF